VVEVYQDNFFQEMARLSELASTYNYIAMVIIIRDWIIRLTKLFVIGYRIPR
jgi:hypothetical protein